MNMALRMYGIIKENPYRLADDIQGVGFKMADEIAQKVGIFTDSDFRIRSGIYYTPFCSLRPTDTPIFRRRSFWRRLPNFCA